MGKGFVKEMSFKSGVEGIEAVIGDRERIGGDCDKVICTE